VNAPNSKSNCIVTNKPTTFMSLLITRVMAAATFVATLLLSGVSTNAGPQGATPWAVIKCKFSDQDVPPAFDPLFITGFNGMAGYWLEQSYGNINLNGTTVFGWYTLPYTVAEGVAKSRGQNIQACIDAAAAEGVDISPFYGVIAIVNGPANFNSGAVGIKRVLLAPWTWNNSFAAHEMGHAYGLDHSFDDTGIAYSPANDSRPGSYGDSWDIMSAMTFGNMNTTFTGSYGSTGPGLNAANLDQLGWVAANRIRTWTGLSEDVTLAALKSPFTSGYLMMKVPIDAANANHYYTIEFRQKAVWDQGIPQDAVLIHEVRTDGLYYLIRADGGAERLTGQSFHDTTNNVRITVRNIDSVAHTAAINVGQNETWVDFAYPGIPFLPENGSFNTPFNTFIEGAARLSYDGTMHIKTGISHEKPAITSRMTLRAYNGPVTIGQ
jgi:hypothetical protein